MLAGVKSIHSTHLRVTAGRSLVGGARLVMHQLIIVASILHHVKGVASFGYDGVQDGTTTGRSDNALR